MMVRFESNPGVGLINVFIRDTSFGHIDGTGFGINERGLAIRASPDELRQIADKVEEVQRGFTPITSSENGELHYSERH
jgi:hypothetical protein